jgi:hypothetical protein
MAHVRDAGFVLIASVALGQHLRLDVANFRLQRRNETLSAASARKEVGVRNARSRRKWKEAYLVQFVAAQVFQYDVVDGFSRVLTAHHVSGHDLAHASNVASIDLCELAGLAWIRTLSCRESFRRVICWTPPSDELPRPHPP